MKLLFLLGIVCISLSSIGNTYYFSSSTGDDLRSSSQAQNSATPWKSIDKLNSSMSLFKSGDSLLFMCGDSFYGSLKITKAGTFIGRLIISSYGKGEKPKITGFRRISDWVNVGTNLWESKATVTTLSSVNMLTINGNESAKGRFPNSTAANGGYLTIDSHVGKTSITSNALSISSNWSGGTAVVRTNHWVLDTNKISSHNSSTVNLTPGTTYEMKNGYGFFIQDHVKTLDVHGEWYFNPITKKLILYYKENPASSSILVSSIDTAISCINVSNISFANLQIEGANRFGIYCYRSPSATIKNCNILFSGDMAIFAGNSGNTNFTAEGNLISNAGNFGINLRSAGDNQIIRSNTIKKIGLFPGMGGVGAQHRTGIANNSNKNHLIENNILDSIGYAGLKFGGDFVTIKNNIISNFTLTVDDGGGIYTANQHGSERISRKVTGNIIYNGIGAPQGTPNTTFGASSGIYTDDNSSGIEISSNSVWNCGKAGLLLHNSYNIKVVDNTFYDNDQAQIELIHDNPDYPSLSNVLLKNNIAFSRATSQYAAFFYTRLNDINTFGAFDSNYYVRPLSDKNIIRETIGLYTTASVVTLHNLPTWKIKYGKDLKSQGSPKLYSAVTAYNDSVVFVYNPEASPKPVSLNGTFIDSRKKVYENIIVLAGYSSAVLFKSSQPPNIKPTIFLDRPKADTTYIEAASVLLSATASDSDGSVKSVKFLKGDQLLFEDSIAPYSYTWHNPGIGAYQISALAVDNRGDTAFSKIIQINNVKSVNHPKVQLVDPLNGSIFTLPSIISLKANAVDDDGTIRRVAFLIDSQEVAIDYTYPYTFDLTYAFPGKHTIQVLATDNDSLFTFSAPVTITVLDTPNIIPTIYFEHIDTINAFPIDTTLNIEAIARDLDGSVTRVEFYVNGIFAKIDSIAPYSFPLHVDIKGIYKITAAAFDNDQMFSISPELSLTFIDTTSTETDEDPSSPPEPAMAPAISLVGLHQTEYAAPATILLQANAYDHDGEILKVEFYKNGLLIGTAHNTPFEISWHYVLPGYYQITAIAYDDDGLTTVSDSIDIRVIRINNPPLISITKPIDSYSFFSNDNILIEANARDADGTIKYVRFYADDLLLETDYSYPYSCTWQNVPLGRKSVSAVATDNDGDSTRSSQIVIEVLQKTFSMSVQPNPARNNITLNIPYDHMNQVYELIVYTNMGIPVFRTEQVWDNNKLNVNLRSLKAGNYLMQVTFSNKIYLGKFIKI